MERPSISSINRELDELDASIITELDYFSQSNVQVPYPVTLYAGNKVMGMLLPSGTIINRAPTRVGQSVTYDEEEFEVVWDGAADVMLLGDRETKHSVWDDIEQFFARIDNPEGK